MVFNVIVWFQVAGEVKDHQTIKCFPPPVLLSGRDVKVSISMNGGHDFSDCICYTVNKSPILSSLRPSCGPRSGGTAIFIHGQNFASKAIDVKVRFSLAVGKCQLSDGIGQKLCTVSAVCESSSTIKCRLPPFEQLLSSMNRDSHTVRQLNTIAFVAKHFNRQLILMKPMLQVTNSQHLIILTQITVLSASGLMSVFSVVVYSQANRYYFYFMITFRSLATCDPIPVRSGGVIRCN